MVVYVISSVAGLSLLAWVVRSPVLRAQFRGRGFRNDRNAWDAYFDAGFEPSWNDDGGGPRESRIRAKPQRY